MHSHLHELKSDKVQHSLCCGFIDTYIQKKKSQHHQFGREYRLFSLIISQSDTFDSLGPTKLDSSIQISGDISATITVSCTTK